RQLRLRLFGVVPDAPDAEELRRRADARQRHEAGGELQEAARAALAAGHHRVDQRHRLLSDPVGAARALQGRDLGAVRRGHVGRKRLTCALAEETGAAGITGGPSFSLPRTAFCRHPPGAICLSSEEAMKTSRRGFLGGVSTAAIVSASGVSLAQKKYD